MRILPAVLTLTIATAAFAQPAMDKTDPTQATQPKSTTNEGAIVAQPGGVTGLDAATRAKGEQVAAKAIAYLKAQQDAKTGGWNIPKEAGKPNLPAFTGLVLNGMLMDHSVKADDPAVGKGVQYILSFQKPDGGIYDGILPTYNTAISLSALARVDGDAAREAIRKGQKFLRDSQWGAETPVVVGKDAPKGAAEVTPAHPFYGGWGYGNAGRPDMSNTVFMLQAMADTGIPSDDPAVQRALVFLQRCQMLEKDSTGKTVNDLEYAKGSKQGGFVYATAENAASAGQGESKAKVIEETLDDGTKVSRLRAYGSITYAGFKSYLYAGLKQDDPRVKAVIDFMGRNYTLTENPGMGNEGLYYYYLMLARAMDAARMSTIDAVTVDAVGNKKTVPHDWRTDLVNRLAEVQNEDGSFKVFDKRWMENDPTLITAYSLIAIEHAMK